ncbi:hypothetical protein [Mycoplasmopsis gallinacea]|uniref:Lipoprotein n=1 Tax=Mycoplasmopsis gallinacea TaxID=29556 RepID=A0A6H0V2P1_9BACT|nr:hypothetical protein [Mycoplasmopsis gallinacea]QIW61959.1 hypothetical protein GOQ20_00530 [Mycoplasmopsis gallinacea]
MRKKIWNLSLIPTSLISTTFVVSSCASEEQLTVEILAKSYADQEYETDKLTSIINSWNNMLIIEKESNQNLEKIAILQNNLEINNRKIIQMQVNLQNLIKVLYDDKIDLKAKKSIFIENQNKIDQLSTEFRNKQMELKGLKTGVKLIKKDSFFRPFINEIIDSASNEYPSVFITRHAAQVYLSSMLLAIGQLSANSDANIPYNDVLFFINSEVWKTSDALSRPGTQRFDLEYLTSKFKPVYDFKKHQWNINDGRILTIDNTKYINNIDNSYDTFFKSVNEIETYLKPYLDAGINKFDFYLPALSLVSLENEKLKNWIFKHANKIVLLSDGNAQQVYFLTDYKKWVLKQSKFYTKKELITKWNRFQNDKNLNKTLIDYHHFLQLDEKVKIFNLERGYIDKFNKEMDSINKSWAKIKIEQYPLNPYEITNMVEFANGNDFVSDFLKVNKVPNGTFLDFIMQGREHYDPNKKNLIFMGSSLFRKDKNGKWRIDQNKRTYKEIQDYFAKMKKLYPPSKYNWFFKLHASYDKKIAKEYISFLLGEDTDQIAIILDPNVAWELMLSNDLNNIKINQSILFDQNGDSKTTLHGIQATTTTILTTMSLLNTNLNWDKEKIKTFVSFRNFPISNTFNLIYRDKYYSDPQEGYKTNIKNMEDVYHYFVDINYFPSKEDWINMNTFLEEN